MLAFNINTSASFRTQPIHSTVREAQKGAEKWIGTWEVIRSRIQHGFIFRGTNGTGRYFWLIERDFSEFEHPC